MILADTSIWIEFFRGKSGFVEVMSRLIEERKIYAVECIFGELLQGARSKREKEILTEYWSHLPKVIEKEMWIKAGTLSFERKLFAKGVGLIDLAIIVTARANKAQIWTLDKKLASILSRSEIFEI